MEIRAISGLASVSTASAAAKPVGKVFMRSCFIGAISSDQSPYSPRAESAEAP